MSENWKIVGVVVLLVVLINLGAFFWARSVSAQPAAVPADGGPTGRTR